MYTSLHDSHITCCPAFWWMAGWTNDTFAEKECCYRNIVTPLMTFSEAKDACFTILRGAVLTTILNSATSEVGDKS